MKAANLHDLWASPDNSRLVSKQFSFRFPVHIAAKLAALGDLYPQKNRTQIVADLLTSALDELEKNMPEALGLPSDDPEHDEMIAEHIREPYDPLFRLGGVRGRFRDLANEHYEALEKELGNDKPEPLFPAIWITEKHFQK